MAYTTINEKTLYIQGGNLYTESTNQFFSLDLSANWSVTNPPWKNLGLGTSGTFAPNDTECAMVSSMDNSELIVWGNNVGISTYNIASGLWSDGMISQPGGLVAAVGKTIEKDPRSGLIYKLGKTATSQTFISYNPNTKDVRTLSLPLPMIAVELFYHTLTWSSKRNTIILFGGYFIDQQHNNNITYEYSPDRDLWSELKATGNVPVGRMGHRLVEYNNGTNMILFGGQFDTIAEVNKVYILDVTTLTWTTGEDIDIHLSRNTFATAVAGDNFVVWGGVRLGSFDSYLSTPVIYNLKSNGWTSMFTLPSPTSSNNGTNISPSTSPTGVDTPSKSGGGSGPVIGGVVGGVVVLAAIGFFVYKRSRARSQGETTVSKQPDSKELSGSHLRQRQPQALIDGDHLVSDNLPRRGPHASEQEPA
ncbi:hypothetical protein BGZ76_009053 [Entomortierella beljakovae]|nr:hypothetical protein BGZ76_009053 [Entomortierella beljakovae]